MNQLAFHIQSFVGDLTALGSQEQAPATARRIDRTELIRRLDARALELRWLAWMWIGMMLIAFGATVACLVAKIARPEVAVPLGGAALLSIIVRVERLWRERERFTLVLEIALQEPDDQALRDLMLQLRSAVVKG